MELITDMKEKIDSILGLNIRGVTLKLLTYRDINEFASMKLSEMNYHIKWANKLGIQDNYCINFSKEDAIKDLEDYTTLIINYNDIIVWFIQMSDFPYYGKNTSGIQIDNLYIKEEYRDKGIAASIIRKLKSKFDNITLEIWYEMDSLEKYKHIGFREICKIMLLD
jgi:hypothetical protein